MTDEESRAFCATGKGGGVKPDCSPPGAVDKSWEESGDRDTFIWGAEELKTKSPIKDGSNAESIAIENSGTVRNALKGAGITLDDAVTLAGGSMRGSHIKVDANGNDIEIETIFPINPDDDSEGYISSSVTVSRDESTGGYVPVIRYGTMFPMQELLKDSAGGVYAVGDIEPGDLSKSQRARIASILMERFVDSVAVAEKSGFARAEMNAVGDASPESDKGYRLWPQFGFDGPVPKLKLRKIPDEIVLMSAGISIPAEGQSRVPRAAIIKGLRAGVTELTVQQLISSPEGKRWWHDNGGTVDLSLDLQDKTSPGYQRFLDKKSQVEKFKKRNENRSLAELYYEMISYRAFCPTGEGNGVKNDCSSEEGGEPAAPPSDTIRSASTVPITSGKQWKKADDVVSYSGKNIPAKSLKDAESVVIIHGKLLAASLESIGLTLDEAAQLGAASSPGATVMVMHGTLGETEAYFNDPENRAESSNAVTFFSKIDIDGIDGGVAVGTTIFVDADDRIVLQYGMLDVTEEARNASAVAIARSMYRGVAESISAAEKNGVEKIVMFAAGGAGDSDRFRGYRIWPRLGFDGVIPRSKVTPTWSPLTGFFNSYGSKIPTRILSPRAVEERKAGKLTIQALYETKEGKEWWEANGGPMEMSMDVGDESSLGWQRFSAMKDKATRRSISNDEFFDWLDFEWEAVVEHRAFCATGEDGGVLNTCSSEGGSGSGSVDREVKEGKKRNVDVMVGGGRRVAVMDKEAKDRAVEDLKSNPKPEGSAAGSATDVWDREFVVRSDSSSKITWSEDTFSEESRRQNGTFISHQAVGQYLSMRHESERVAAGGSGPGGIIDLSNAKVSDEAINYVADALAEDAVHAYEVLGVDPGFYSTDLDKTMSSMSKRHPELETDENSKFVFTALLAITSSGQGPDSNLADADGLYRMWKENGTVVPSSYGGGARDVTTSLKNFQLMIDSLGVERTRNLLSGYAPASRIAKVFRTLAEKSGDPNWQERTGSSELNFPKPMEASGELKDEVVPLFSVFGPKIGSFYANLSGRHDFLTMDRWLMRSVGRVTGDLITRSSPKQAKDRAKAILSAIESGKWDKDFLFGTDKSLGFTKESLVRSLKIQEKTGVIEENGEAFAWAKAAERAHQKTKSATGGSYGRHENETIRALHAAGNSLFKSLINEQQDPRTGTARSKIREVFKRIQDKFEKSTGRRPDVDEIQAALWQYEKRLWKHLGAKTNIDDNSLFSAAADGLLGGKISPRKYSPSSKRSLTRIDGDPESEFDTQHFDEEQAVWISDLIESGVDIVSLLSELEQDAEENRNFAALDAEVRAFCPTGDGKGVDNSCGGKSSSSKAFTMKGSAKVVDSGSKLATKSWVSPSGDFYPVSDQGDSVETHEEWAEKNVSLKSGDHSESDDYGYVGVSDTLLKAGWLRVSGNARTVYVQSGRGSVTSKQKSALKDMAIQNEKSDILLDGFSNRLPTKTLWSSRAFCPTGDGGGVQNDCGSGSHSMPKSSYDDPKNKTSWMSPSGDFYPVDRSKDIGASGGGNTHEGWARAHGVSGGEDSLLDNGWLKVTNSGKTLYLKSFPGKSPSHKQLSSAKDFAVASNSFDDVVSDSFPGKQKTLWSSRAFCPTGDGGGLDNSCSASDGGASQVQLHAASTGKTVSELAEMVSAEGSASADVAKSLGKLKTEKRFELVGSLIKTMPSDSVDAGDYAAKTVQQAAPKGVQIPASLSNAISSAVEGIYADAIRQGNDNRLPRADVIAAASFSSACLVAQISAAVREFPEVVDSQFRVMGRVDIFNEIVSQGVPQQQAAGIVDGSAAFYDFSSDEITVVAENSANYIDGILAVAAVDANTGDVPFYSTSQLGHSITHEVGHKIHFLAMRETLGLPRGQKLEDYEKMLLLTEVQRTGVALLEHLRSRPDVVKKLQAISGYAMKNPQETAAEYYTSLALGVAKRDPDIDGVMTIIGFPVDKLPPGKKGKK
jgi:hypothetical protein